MYAQPNERIWHMVDLEFERNVRSLTQEGLSELSGVSRSHIANIERGHTFPSIRTAKKLSKVLQINWQEFFDEMED